MKEEKKEKSWEGKKKFYKGGDPNVHRGFNWWTWSRMTDPEKAQWTEFSEVEKAPIPKEVIEFKEKIAKKAEVSPSETDDYINVPGEKTYKPVMDVDEPEPLQGEEQAKAAIKAKLKELDIKYSHNSKLETLQKKLADATNPE